METSTNAQPETPGEVDENPEADENPEDLRPDEWGVPVDAEVQCTDGICGHSTYVILNPVTDEVTHIVVEREGFPFTDRLVPMGMVEHSTSKQVELRCSSDELAEMESFTETEFVRPANVSSLPLLMWPYAAAEEALMPLEHERIPAGELAVRKSARIRATDGEVGRVDEFLVDPEDGQITHLVMREGHLWGSKEIAIPVSAIAQIKEDMVYLKLDKAEIEALPKLPIRRRPAASD
jgi:sporulation protein YlmC with PRC-barrel domain